jgi:hypothetical protein
MKRYVPAVCREYKKRNPKPVYFLAETPALDFTKRVASLQYFRQRNNTFNPLYFPSLEGETFFRRTVMNKKLFLVVLVLASVAGGMWAQSGDAPWGGKKNFVSADIGLIVGGARYERLLTQKISIGVDAYWANSFILFNELELGAFARFYLWKGLYGELGLGFHIHTGTEDVDTPWGTRSEIVATTGFSISPGLGWKFDPGKAGGFFVEPGVIVPITIGSKDRSWGDPDVGVSTGFVLFCGLGWAF